MAKAIQKYLHTNSNRFLSINLLTKTNLPIHKHDKQNYSLLVIHCKPLNRLVASLDRIKQNDYYILAHARSVGSIGLSTRMRIKKRIESEFSEFTFNSNEARLYAMCIAICSVNHKCSIRIIKQIIGCRLHENSVTMELLYLIAPVVIWASYIKLQRFNKLQLG